MRGGAGARLVGRGVESRQRAAGLVRGVDRQLKVAAGLLGQLEGQVKLGAGVLGLAHGPRASA